jgi:hypothetical protein
MNSSSHEEIHAIVPKVHAHKKRRLRTKSSVTQMEAQPGAHVATMVSHGSGSDDQTFNPPGLPVTVTHGGGLVLQRPKVQLLFWGNAWNTAPLNGLASQVFSACTQVLRGHYLDEMRQYGTGGNGFVTGANLVLSEPPNGFSSDTVGGLVWDLIDGGHFPDPHDSPGPNFYFVFMPPGIAPENNKGLAAHSFADDTDFFDTARIWTGWTRFGSLDFLTLRFSHELVEFCSDPGGDGWQVEPRNDDDWNEIVDVCKGSAGRLDDIAVEAYYSASQGVCVIPNNPPPPIPPPRLPNGRYRVQCIQKENRGRFIIAVGGELADGTKWRMLEDVAFLRVESGELSFFVSEGGLQDDLIIEVSFFGFKYFRTRGDSAKIDNLASLTGCGGVDRIDFV